MRHLIALPVIAGLTCLGGCGDTSFLSPTSISTATTNLVQDVQALTASTATGIATACKFVPSAETITSLATSGSVSAQAGLSLASAIAAVVCGGVNAKVSSKRRGGILGGPVSVPGPNGIVITGYFVQ